MGFEKGRRFGKFWDDTKTLNELITTHSFNTTGKNEHDFKISLASSMMTMKKNFNFEVATEFDKSDTVKSIYCFGKNHRPDMMIGDKGLAIEMKFIRYSGLKDSIGQGYLYRLHYRFVFLVLIISEKRKKIHFDLQSGKEDNLKSLLQHLADTMNIFTYIVPAFSISPRMKKCISFYEPINPEAGLRG